MAITCSELFAGIDCSILGRADEPVAGLAYRSDAVKPQDAFFCIVGLKVDGHSFAQDAIDRGAAVIVSERKLYLADATDVTLVIVADSRKAMAQAAANFYGRPSESFQLVGVTGTNGKTTTTHLVDHIGRSLGHRGGLIGTVGNAIDGRLEPTHFTTPESVDLQALFARLRDAGCDLVSMEVSSHGLSFKRPWGSQFDVVAFTNLTQDHLDFHHSFDEYFEAKARLFSDAYPAARVINIADPHGAALCARCKNKMEPVFTTGFTDAAYIHPKTVAYAPDHTDIELCIGHKIVSLRSPLVGGFNVDNVMTAAGIALGLGFDIDAALDAVTTFPGVVGRLERVPEAQALGLTVFVDFAHTPDALEKAIASVRAITSGHLITVFGCEGDKDRGKRPLMGAAALASDFAILTNDNPQGEDPKAIAAEVIAGMRPLDPTQERYAVELDRGQALRLAFDHSMPGDAILIAGKGHERAIVASTGSIPFNDRDEVVTIVGERA